MADTNQSVEIEQGALDQINQDYGADKIKVLEGLEAVRKRPAMYIGSTGELGLHHLVYEVVDNSIDEALAGVCDRIEIVIHEDSSVTVTDNGRGIPVDIHPQTKKPALEVVMTTLHAGAKFGGDGYKISGGLHGVGVSVVNALSEWLQVEVRRNGKVYRQRYARGDKQTELDVTGRTKETGTTVSFKPDPQIFTDLVFRNDTIAMRLRELSFLNKGVSIMLTDERQQPAKIETFHAKGGLKEMVQYLNAKTKPLHSEILYLETEKDDISIELALQYNDGYNENVFSFVNNINTHEGGTHLTGLKAALTRTINNHATKGNFLKKADFTLSGDDVREGLTAVLAVKIREPQFEGQTKTKLGNTDVRSFVETTVNQNLAIWLEEHPGDAKRIVQKCVQAAKARQAARQARDLARRKGILDSSLPGKLADCQLGEPEKTELFIVEGKSAAGPAKAARNSETQAILPIRGKILNVEKARLAKALQNLEVQDIITAYEKDQNLDDRREPPEKDTP